MKKAPEHLRFAAVAVDITIFGFYDDALHVLLGTVDRPPHYQNVEAFIGGLIEVDETAEVALARHLANKTQLRNVFTEQLYTFSAIDRDKRNRVISVGYIGLVRPDDCKVPLPAGLRWCPVTKLPKLAYDHAEIFKAAVARLQGKLSYTTIAQFLLPKHFTLSELQAVYERILKRTLDKRNFRKKILALDVIEETGDTQEGVKNRPAALYRFKKQALTELSPIV